MVSSSAGDTEETASEAPGVEKELFEAVAECSGWDRSAAADGDEAEAEAGVEGARSSVSTWM
jgi:hypothetical protein